MCLAIARLDAGPPLPAKAWPSASQSSSFASLTAPAPGPTGNTTDATLPLVEIYALPKLGQWRDPLAAMFDFLSSTYLHLRGPRGSADFVCAKGPVPATFCMFYGQII